MRVWEQYGVKICESNIVVGYQGKAVIFLNRLPSVRKEYN